MYQGHAELKIFMTNFLDTFSEISKNFEVMDMSERAPSLSNLISPNGQLEEGLMAWMWSLSWGSSVMMIEWLPVSNLRSRSSGLIIMMGSNEREISLSNAMTGSEQLEEDSMAWMLISRWRWDGVVRWRRLSAGFFLGVPHQGQAAEQGCHSPNSIPRVSSISSAHSRASSGMVGRGCVERDGQHNGEAVPGG